MICVMYIHQHSISVTIQRKKHTINACVDWRRKSLITLDWVIDSYAVAECSVTYYAFLNVCNT